MKCLITNTDNSTSTINVFWKVFSANCPRAAEAGGACSSLSNAYVPAITVCLQNLYTTTAACDSVAKLCT